MYRYMLYFLVLKMTCKNTVWCKNLKCGLVVLDISQLDEGSLIVTLCSVKHFMSL